MQHGLLRLPRLNPVVIHGDVHFGQFMLTKDDVLAILDFDGCCYGDPAQDLADLIVDPHLKATEGTNPTYASNGGMFTTRIYYGTADQLSRGMRTVG